ncbi:uncharacterized protein LOC114951759 [Acropora millepora]|uniref:uncharacterized protein LOC114951759 n=1 Tax=Acropora millepora TaxID=45264 RepID=UPI001CF18727|nr:uncharacterized protein LOC114951759 [Acropora millepora]
MVLGIISTVAAGVGALAGGFGVFKGASRAGKAAQRVAANADRFLESMAGDVKEVKTLLIREVWPAMNVTLMKFNDVLLNAQRLIETGTFATKALTLLIFLCTVLVCSYILTPSRMPTRDRRRHSVTLQEVAVQFVKWMCLLMAVVLVCHLITELRIITSPRSIPLIFVIPSFSTLIVCLGYIEHIVRAFFKLLILIWYCIIGFPMHQFKSPAEKASCYRSSFLLSTLLFPAIILSYGLIAYFSTLIINDLFKRQRPLPEKIFLAYISFYIAAIAINFIMEIVMIIIRRLWAFSARRRYFLG